MTGTGVPRIVSLLFDLSVCLCRPECLSVTGLRFLNSVQYCIYPAGLDQRIPTDLYLILLVTETDAKTLGSQ